MSEFTDLLKEAFTGDEPFDPDQGREATLEAIDSIERRMRLVRWMVWFSVSLMFALTIWMVVLLLGAPAEVATNRRLFYLALLVLGMQGTWVGKNWFYNMQNHSRVMRELKRTQLMVLELREQAGRG